MENSLQISIRGAASVRLCGVERRFVPTHDQHQQQQLGPSASQPQSPLPLLVHIPGDAVLSHGENELLRGQDLPCR